MGRRHVPVALAIELERQRVADFDPDPGIARGVPCLPAASSTSNSFSRRPGVPSACSAYIGWKQPAVSAARAATARKRAAIAGIPSVQPRH